MTKPVFASALAAVLCVALAAAQTKETKNPYEGDAKAINQGKQLYQFTCAACHGLDGRGYRAPDLTTGQFMRGNTDSQLFRIVMQGIPGTDMPGVAMYDTSDDDVWMLIAYVRSLSGSAVDAARGNPQNGENIFSGKGGCGQCHMVRGRGGRLGPDLSRIGAARSRAALIREIRTPSRLLTDGYLTVTVVTRDGQRIRGCIKNEDPFSIQIMDTREQLHSFQKADLREVIHEKQSLMPEYGVARLTDTELDDLIAYLRDLRGLPAKD